MRVLRALGVGPKQLVSYEVTPTRTSFVAGAAAILAAMLPLSAEGPLTVWRVLTAFAFCILGGLLILGGAARRRVRSTVDLESRQLRGAGRSGSLDTATRVRLASGVQIVKAAEQPAYRAELCFGDGAAILMAEDQDPGAVARAAHLLGTELQLPVVSGWGLPDAATPWEPANTPADVLPARDEPTSPDAPDTSGVPESQLVVRYAFDRIVCWILGGCAVLIGGTTLILVATGAAGAPAGPVLVSYGLVTGMILLVLLVAAAAGTRQLRLIAAGSWLRVEWRTLGIPSGRRVIRRHGLGVALPVRPAKEIEPTHLLFRTAEGAFALPCPDAQELERMRGWLREAAEAHASSRS